MTLMMYELILQLSDIVAGDMTAKRDILRMKISEIHSLYLNEQQDVMSVYQDTLIMIEELKELDIKLKTLKEKVIGLEHVICICDCCDQPKNLVEVLESSF
jgi:hypothetical protein